MDKEKYIPISRKLSYKKIIDLLAKSRFVVVDERLTPAQWKVVDDGFAILRAYEDDRVAPYPFSPVYYTLETSDMFDALYKRLKEKTPTIFGEN